jgi:hypothetical protein
MGLRDAIQRDILREDIDPPDLSHCLLCRRSFLHGTGPAGRFCHQLCVEAHDTGFICREGTSTRSGGAYRHSKPVALLYAFPIRGDGFVIECRGCKKQFVSKGLRSCSAECERQSREQEAITATMAEVKAETTGFVHRKCEHCGGNIPRYVGVGKARKLTKKTTRFCSVKCANKARRLVRSGKTDLSANGAQKPLENGPSESAEGISSVGAKGTSVPLDLIGAHYRWPGARLDTPSRKAIIQAETPPGMSCYGFRDTRPPVCPILGWFCNLPVAQPRLLATIAGENGPVLALQRTRQSGR